jgi:uncharacterized protein (DUF2141 family)
MKRYAFLTVVVAAAVSLAPTPSTAQMGRTVTVNVSAFRNTRGVLGCRLYAGPKGFPKELTHKAEQRVPIKGSSAACTFAGVAPGTYAVAVVHDENGNSKVDTNFVGVPTEGYGVSNNRTYALSWPKWDEAKFPVVEGRDLSLAVTLRY